MYKIIILIVLISYSIAGFAQGNLQFNRVFFVETSFVSSSTLCNEFQDVTITVPTGKVWKIETAHGTQKTNFIRPNYNATVSVLINDHLICHYTNSSSALVVSNYLPMWLPAGNYTMRVSVFSCPGGNTVLGAISGIEFNAVP